MGSAKTEDSTPEAAVLGRWRESALLGQREYRPSIEYPVKQTTPPTDAPAHSKQPLGGVVVAQLGPDEFLVPGTFSRVPYDLARPAAGGRSDFLSVEVGTLREGKWVTYSRLNGDQSDWDLNFGVKPVLMRVRLLRVQ